MAALRKAETLPLQERLEAQTKAGELFAHGVVNGISAADYQYLVNRMSGTPLFVVRGGPDAAHGFLFQYPTAVGRDIKGISQYVSMTCMHLP
jgi:hypothetical protein